MKSHLFILALTTSTSLADLVVSEIHYNPPGATELTEFVEFKNTGVDSITLAGATFDGLGTVTLTQSEITAGGFLVVAKDSATFFGAYNTLPGGTFSGSLSNSGETVGINTVGQGDSKVHYWDGGDEDPVDPDDDDRPLWPDSPDGDGFTLVLQNPNSDELEIDTELSWRPSINIGGSPGADEPFPETVNPIVINEVRTRDGQLSNDAVEFYNPTGQAVDISGWSLSDNLDDPRKFVIPDPFLVPANGYATLSPTNGFSLSLSSQGERIFLYEAVNNVLTGYIDGFHFEGSADGKTFIRVENADGHIRYPQAAPTLGQANAAPDVADVIITEIFYSPSSGGIDPEFIEFANISDGTVLLYDPATATDTTSNNWRIEGVNFVLNGLKPSIAPGQLALVVPVAPETFRSTNNIPADVLIFGPYTAAFSNGGETAGLQRPESLDDIDTTAITYIDVDEVLYANNSPWPTEAATSLRSLVRTTHRIWSDQSTAWQLGLSEKGTPGTLDDDYLLWAHRTFPELFLPNVDAPTGPLSDLDNDGFNNLYAYAFDLDPRKPTLNQLDKQPVYNSQRDIPLTSYDFTTTGNLNPAATYTPEITMDLTDSIWSTDIPEAFSTVRPDGRIDRVYGFPDGFSAQKLFFRLRVDPVDVP